MVVRMLCLKTAWPPSHPLKNNHTGGQAVQLSKYDTFTWRALPTCIQPFHISQSFNFSSSFIVFCWQKKDRGHCDGEDKNLLACSVIFLKHLKPPETIQFAFWKSPNTSIRDILNFANCLDNSPRHPEIEESRGKLSSPPIKLEICDTFSAFTGERLTFCPLDLIRDTCTTLKHKLPS